MKKQLNDTLKKYEAKLAAKRDQVSCLLKKGSLQILDAPAGDDLGTFLELEHFDRHVAVIADLAQSGCYRFEVYLTEAGPFRFLSLAWKCAKCDADS